MTVTSARVLEGVMRKLAVVLVAFVAGCRGGGSTQVGTSSTPPTGGGTDGGPGMPTPDGGGTPGGGGAGGSGGGDGSGGGGSGGSGGGGSSGGGTSACSATPRVVGTAFEPRATDGVYIYGYGAQQIARIPVGGGAAESVVGGIDTSIDFDLLVDDRYVYWTVQSNGGQLLSRMFRAAKSGGDQPTFLTVTDLHIVADADFVYTIVDWMGNGNGLVRVAKADGHVTDEQIGGGGGAAGVDGAYVYYVAPGPQSPGTASLWRVSKLVDGRPTPQMVASWDVYNDFGARPPRFVSDGTAMFAWDFGRIIRVDFADGAVTLLYDPQRDTTVASGDRPGQMALDGSSVYWTSFNDYVEPRYAVDAVNKDGSAPRTIHAGSSAGQGIVVAGDSVYYDLDGALYRQCKR
jgi:hypothetical protein